MPNRKLRSSILDIEECATEKDNCHIDSNCTNTKGSFFCTCHTGYSGDGATCAGELNIVVCVMNHVVQKGWWDLSQTKVPSGIAVGVITELLFLTRWLKKRIPFKNNNFRCTSFRRNCVSVFPPWFFRCR